MKKIKVKILNKISDKIFTVLDKNYDVSETHENPEAILVRSQDMANYEIGSELKCVGRAGAGYNNIPVPKMTSAGVVVFNTPGANANAVKELTILGLLLASRDIYGGLDFAKSLKGKGGDVPKLVEKGKSQFGGTEIKCKTLGVLGLGAIGVKVANSALALEMDVMGSDPYISAEQKLLLNQSVKLTSYDEVLAKADFISLHIPLLDSTKGMVNKDFLSKLKKGSVILNMSRAELVNADDIKEALASGQLKNYVVDFPTDEILDVKGIIAIPHLGASTEEAEENCAIMASGSIKSYIEDGNIINSVNYPNIFVKKEDEFRLTITYDANILDIDEEVKKITRGFKSKTHFAKRGDIGYAIIDSEFAILPSAFEGISGIKAIKKI